MEWSIKKEAIESLLLMNNVDYNQNHNIYTKYDKIMSFGGDNFAGVCDNLQIQGNHALIVNGSGDPPLELVYRNFSNIDAFDINCLSRHILNLKVAAIQALSYEEFVIFSKKIIKENSLYEKVAFWLPEETKGYFKILFEMEKTDNIYNNLFTHKYVDCFSEIWEYCQRNFSFYNEKKFYELKEKLLMKSKDPIQFHNMNLFEPQQINQKYDFIYFSNILLFNSIEIKKFITELLPTYINLLNNDGLLVLFYMHYFYQGDFTTTSSSFYSNYFDSFIHHKNQQIYELCKGIFNVEIVIPPSGFGRGLGYKDSVIAYKKIKDFK